MRCRAVSRRGEYHAPPSPKFAGAFAPSPITVGNRMWNGCICYPLLEGRKEPISSYAIDLPITGGMTHCPFRDRRLVSRAFRPTLELEARSEDLAPYGC
jgi:hypothetical protein